MPKPVYLHNIATIVPEAYYTQEFVLDFLLKLLGDRPDMEKILPKVYQNTGIHKRHTVISDYGKDPTEFTFYPKNKKLQPEPSTKIRNDLFIHESNRLSLLAVRKLLKELHYFAKNKITHVITVSCTGMSAPGFDFHIVKSLQLNPGIHRFHIGFMGCFAAFPAMKLAKYICEAEPSARVLIVNVELCTLHFQQSSEIDMLIANAIFADGVSAALVSSEESDSEGNKIVLKDFASYTIDKSEKDMAWKIGDTGFDMKLSVYVPKLIQKNIKPIISHLFQKIGLQSTDIKIWAIHPGGRAILDRIAKTLNLTYNDLNASYETLRDFGNMSSVTVLFVLKNILENKAQIGKIFSAAFGPGLTVESAYMEKI